MKMISTIFKSVLVIAISLASFDVFGQCLSISQATTDVSCFGGNNGQIVLTITPGLPPNAQPPYTVFLSFFDGFGYTVLASHFNVMSNTMTFTPGNGSLNEPGANAFGIPATVGAEHYRINVSASGGGSVTCLNKSLFPLFVGQPDELLITTNSIDPDCDPTPGVGNGQIDISVNGGVTPYSIVWTGPTAIPNGTLVTSGNLEAGAYSVTVTDANSCSTSQNFTVPITTQANAGPPTGLTCGTNSFALSGNAPGASEIGTWTGPAGVTFSPSANDPNATANNLLVGSNILTWTITDAGGLCVGTSDNITVTYSPTMTLNTAITNANCNGTNTGAIDLSIASGGIAPFTYLWSNGATTQDLTNIPAGTYSVTVTDASTCTATLNNIVVTQPVVIVINSTASTNPSCNGTNNGSITVVASGGTGALTYTLMPGAVVNGTGVFTGLAPNTYTVSVTDVNGCGPVVTSNIVITEPAALTLGTPTVTNASCTGASNGAIAITATGGTGTLTYTLNPGAVVNTTGNFTGLAAGTYTVTVDDAGGCAPVVSSNITITAPAALTFGTPTVTNASCNGVADGTISISATGGTGVITYTLNPGAIVNTTGNFTGVAPGTYTVTADDAGGCSPVVSSNITVTAPAALTFGTPTVTNASCNGVSNGAISISATGGTGGLTYTLNPGALVSLTGNFVGLAAGTYAVTVDDAGGCPPVVSANITVTAPAALTFGTPTVTNPSCTGASDASISVTATGGTGVLTYTLNPGAVVSTTGNFTGLAAGTYTVTVDDAGGCPPVVSSNITITAPTALTFGTPTVTNASCSGTSNGSIAITATGGTGTLTYTLNPGAVVNTTGNFTGLAAGTYTVTVDDAGGCAPVVSSNITITAPAALVLGTPTVTNASCAGISNATISISATGGTGTLTYTLNPGAIVNTTGNFTGLAAGTYTVSVDDAGGCAPVVSSNITITAPAAPTFGTPTVTNASCNGVSDGSISITATGGTGALTYTLNPGAVVNTTGTFTGLAAGTYTVSVDDAGGCAPVISSNITITAPAALTFGTPTVTNPSCSGTSNGAIAITATGGTGTLTYTLNPGAVVNTTGNFTGLAAGTYTVTVDDAGGCAPVVSSNITITAPAALTFGTPTVTNASCSGTSNGAIAITATGGTGTLTYTLNPGAVVNTTGNFTGLAAGTYTVTVDDAGGCASVVSSNITITAPAALTFGTPTVTNASCTGAPDGAISIAATGGTGVLTYTLNPGAVVNTTGNFTGLAAGTYTVTVDDAGGCAPVVSSNITITAPAGPAFGTPTVTNASCNGVSDGAIAITATGGTGTLTYTLNPGAVVNTTGNFTGLAAGTYTVTVDDAGGCAPVVSSNITITAPAGPAFGTPTVTNASCNGVSDGAIAITATGGTGTLTYTLNPGAVVNTTGNFTGLAAGTYTVTVDDAGGCAPVVSANISITAPAALTFGTPAVTNASCNGTADGAISIAATGGTGVLTYTLNPGAVVNTTGNFTGLAAGTYTVTVDDAGGCAPVVSSNITITAPAALTFGTPTVTNASCTGSSDGAISIAATGGTGTLTYTLNPGAVVNTTGNFAGLAAGTYTVTVDDAGGCAPAVSSNITITAPAGPVFGTPTVTNASCNGVSDGTITITATGGTGTLTYTLSPGAVVNTTGAFTGLAAGTYTVSVDDAGGCPAVVSANITITAPAGPTFGAPTVTNASCGGASDGAIAITATGGTGTLTYTLNPGAVVNTTGTFTGLVAGTYTVSVDDAGGCPAVVSANITITAPAGPTFGTPTVTNASCSGVSDGAISITATGGTGALTYTLNPGAVTNSTGDFTGLAAGTYTVTVDDAGACPAVVSANITITTPAAPTFGTPTVTNASCNGVTDGAISITATGGTGVLTYTLNPGAVVNTTGNFTGLAAGTYTVSVDDAGGCPAVVSANISVTEPDAIVATISGDATLCATTPATSTPITISFAGGGPQWHYVLTDGITTFPEQTTISSLITLNFSPTTSRTYTLVSVRDDACAGTVTGDAEIIVNPSADASLTVDAAITDLCTNGVAEIIVRNAQNGVTYQLRNVADDAAIGASAVGDGTDLSLFSTPLIASMNFYVTATAPGCPAVRLTDEASVNVAGVINAGADVEPEDSPICEGATTRILILTPESGVLYQLRRDGSNVPVGPAVAWNGTDPFVALDAEAALTATTSYNILASNGTCSVQLDEHAVVEVDPLPVASLPTNAVIADLCVNGIGEIEIHNSQEDVFYTLLNAADDTPMSATVEGNNGTLTIPTTNPLTATTTFKIVASSGGVCADVELAPVTINVNGTIDATLAVAPQTDPICEDNSTVIVVTGSEVGVDYTLRNAADNSVVFGPAAGTGSDLPLNTNLLSATTTFNVLASNGTCSIELDNTATVTVEPKPVATLPIDVMVDPLCVNGIAEIRIQNSQTGVTYQLRDEATDTPSGLAEAGNGGTIILESDPLTVTTTFNVLASSGGACPAAELTTLVTVNVNGTLNNTLNTEPNPVTPICAGGAAFVVVQGAEAGISYQLRRDDNNSNVGVAQSLPAGGDLSLPTGNLNTTTTFNVLAFNGTCSIELNDKETIIVNPGPGTTPVLSALPAAVCPGGASSIVVTNPELNVTYVLRRDADNSIIESRLATTTAPITYAIPASELTATAAFNVLATQGTCSVELGPISIIVRPAGDPICNPGDACGLYTLNPVFPDTQRPTCDNQNDGVLVMDLVSGPSPVNNYEVTLYLNGIAVSPPQIHGPGLFTFQNLSAGDYEVRVNDFGGHICIRPYSMQVETTVEATASGFVDANCFGTPTGQAILTVTGGSSPYDVFYDGQWHPNYVSGNVINNLPPDGTYNILVRDDASDACPAEVSVTINSAAPQIFATFTTEPGSCGNATGAIRGIAATGGSGSGYQFAIDGGTPSTDTEFEGLSGGSHILTVVDDAGCSADFPFTITFDGIIVYTVNPVQPVSCTIPGELQVSLPAGITYEVGYGFNPNIEPAYTEYPPLGGPVKIAVEGGGDYYVFVRLPGSTCSSRQGPFTIMGSKAMYFEPVVECIDNSLVLRLDNLQGDEFAPAFVTIIDELGIQKEQYQINIQVGGSKTFFNSSDPNDPIDYPFLTESDHYTIRLSQTDEVFFCPMKYEDKVFIPAKITAVVTNIRESYPDIMTGGFTVTNIEEGEEPFLPFEIKIELDQAAVGGQDFETNFEPVDQNNNLAYEKEYEGIPAGLYNIYIKDNIGCSSTITALVPLDKDVYVPNLFTPNNDGHNETFFVRNLPDGGNVKLVITNRWGKQVFKSENYQNDWAAEGVIDGIYFYQLQSSGGDPLTGWVEVLRGAKP